MVAALNDAQALVLLALWVASLILEAWAVIEAVRPPAQAYVAAGKLTKPAWIGITVVALLVGFVVQPHGLLGVGLLAVVAAGVFLADVRPKVRALTPRRGSGGVSGRGPYGSW